MKRLKQAILQIVGVTAITVALLEGLVAVSFAYPRASLIPLPLLRTLHQRFDRQVIQVMPSCAMYDERVTYLLRPGSCTFENREFRTTYHINSLGLRDDEASLHGATVVVLGDSLAMGWGVEQDEAFPAVFERLTGRRTLNAGMSSFGTVRELRMLERIDRSRLEHLVIQYTDNDQRENETFVTTGDLTTLSADEYQRTVDAQAAAMRYLPGKLALNLLVQLQSGVRQAVARPTSAGAAPDASWRRQASLFLDVLRRSPVDLGHRTVTVLSLNLEFIDEVRAQIQPGDAPWIAGLRFVDAGAATSFPGAFFVLDDHPTAAGQAAIARALANTIGTANR